MESIEWKYGAAFTDGEIVRFYVGTKKYGDLVAGDEAEEPVLCAQHEGRANLAASPADRRARRFGR